MKTQGMMDAGTRHAVILAAGLGSRLRPLTETLPKPMVEVNGRPIITTILDGLLAAGVDDITIVCGWQKEKLLALQGKYPHLSFIENPDYATSNNIASILCAGERVEDALIVEGDLYIAHPEHVFCNVACGTNYIAFPVSQTDDWCFFTDDERRITRMAVGSDGQPCWQMVGCSYWTAEDGRRLLAHAREVYDAPGGHARYWDEIALDAHLGEYDIHVRPCTAEDVIEIDTVEELHALEEKVRNL